MIFHTRSAFHFSRVRTVNIALPRSGMKGLEFKISSHNFARSGSRAIRTERRKNKKINPLAEIQSNGAYWRGKWKGKGKAGSNQCEWKWTLGRPIVLHASGSRWMSRGPKTAEHGRISPKRRTLGPRHSVAPPHPVVLRMPRCVLRIRGISVYFSFVPINRTSLCCNT